MCPPVAMTSATPAEISSDSNIGPLIAVTSLVFTAGAILLIFLVLLGGAVTGSPEDQIYFLRVDTSGIKGAPKTTDWTFWNYCDGSSGYNADCTSVAAAYPFDPPRNFGVTDGIPDAFIGSVMVPGAHVVHLADTLIGRTSSTTCRASSSPLPSLASSSPSSRSSWGSAPHASELVGSSPAWPPALPSSGRRREARS